MREHLISHLVCLGRHTVSGLAVTAGKADRDWSAQYRLYSHARFDPAVLFETSRVEIERSLADDEPLVVSMDDSLIHKTGTKIPGVAYRRDPLGPKFQVNLIRGQRFLQLSAAFPFSDIPWARLIPIDFQLIDSVKKPKASANEQEWAEYRRASRYHRVTAEGSRRIQALRQAIPDHRRLWIVADGRFTNRVVLKDLPNDTVFIGRIREDAKLYFLPPVPENGRGRKRIYGDPAPTPRQIRGDEKIPWINIPAFATGKLHEFRVKVLPSLRWRATSKEHDVQVVVIAPLGYRPNKKSKVLYRQPAYLICTDPTIPVEKILQAYLWRWDIEVNFRDQKTLLGLGQTQVRNPNSVSRAPALLVAAYALLLTAAQTAFGSHCPHGQLPTPKWNRKVRVRSSTQQIIRTLRHDLWAQALSPNFSDFTSPTLQNRKSEKYHPDLESALFMAHL
jgi:hypothetical protein